MSNFQLYDMARYIIGDLPSEYNFIYIIFTCLEALVLLWCLLSPFIIAYNFVRGK